MTTIGIFLGGLIDKRSEVKISNFFNTTISMLKTDYKLVVFSPYKNNGLANLINEKVETRYLPTADNWQQQASISKQLLNDIDLLIVFEWHLLTTLNCNTYKIIDSMRAKIERGDITYGYSFNSTRRMYMSHVFVREAKRVLYFVTDPTMVDLLQCENLIGKKYYISNRNGYSYLPTLDHALLTTETKCEQRTIDFLFSCSDATNSRGYASALVDRLKRIPNSKVWLASKSRDILPQFQYDELLSRAKFTLIIPSYEPSAFSSLRMFAAIQHNCVPLVLSTTDLTDVNNTWPDIYSILTEHCITTEDVDLTKYNYDEIIQKLQSCESVKRLRDVNYCKQQLLDAIESILEMEK